MRDRLWNTRRKTRATSKLRRRTRASVVGPRRVTLYERAKPVRFDENSPYTR